ncbi:hypothetical protein [Methanolobus sp.]|uniref:hypothetical protein n=1 Tax=Methanolobus sp. TaxID=1874737 RepID=UPI0025FA472D|nr:hypothetical protein [Methanolobus sp.]
MYRSLFAFDNLFTPSAFPFSLNPNHLPYLLPLLPVCTISKSTPRLSHSLITGLILIISGRVPKIMASFTGGHLREENNSGT